MPRTQALLVLCLVFAWRPNAAEARPSYKYRIPNAELVRDVSGVLTPAVGHVRGQIGGGKVNAFGRDFWRLGEAWTRELCDLDSDGDGLSNGLELGDPNCVWTPGNAPEFTFPITHPGIANLSPSAPSPPPAVTDSAVPAWVIVHVAVMLLAVGVLLPIGFCIPLLMRSRGSWRRVHTYVVCAGAGLGLVGLVIALMQMSSGGFAMHGGFGIATATLVLAQVLAAFARGFLPLKHRAKWRNAHLWTGRLLVVLCGVVVQTGYANLALQVALTGVLVWGWVHALAIVGGFALAQRVRHWRESRVEGDFASVPAEESAVRPSAYELHDAMELDHAKPPADSADGGVKAQAATLHDLEIYEI
jgi:hypothetical protein